jgi:hypothetical protein
MIDTNSNDISKIAKVFSVVVLYSIWELVYLSLLSLMINQISEEIIFYCFLEEFKLLTRFDMHHDKNSSFPSVIGNLNDLIIINIVVSNLAEFNNIFEISIRI